MKRIQRIAFIGNSLPRKCGISTFTGDLQQSIATRPEHFRTMCVVMTDDQKSYDYPAPVEYEIHDQVLAEYAGAADFLNNSNVDVVSLQHEFGIFGGEAGSHVLDLLSRLQIPVVTTLHTVLTNPSAVQASVLRKIAGASTRIVVMARKARELLQSVYGIGPQKIDIIPHGVPDFPFVEPDAAKSDLGFSGRPVILTFGLLSPNKGVEIMIDAMPGVLRDAPEAVYVVLGATHPHLMAKDGERYRESLVERARALGIENSVVFLNHFVDQPTLLNYISMCDVYVTPYHDEAQMTSGTLAYSIGLGKAVVSTPYWHAKELLADERGILVPFGDSAGFTRAVSSLLLNDARRQHLRMSAYTASRSMIWARTADRYLAVFDSARQSFKRQIVSRDGALPQAPTGGGEPQSNIGPLLEICDDTGIFQHTLHDVPDRAHGYCVDDNARALIVSTQLALENHPSLPLALTGRFAAFVQHAWNPENGRFRNFMSFDRRWLEPAGSEDSHGRTLWALGICARDGATQARRRWALELFAAALPAVANFTSPRAWAFTLLGLDAHCEAAADNPIVRDVRADVSGRLMAILGAVETPDWVWFENGLAYDNARLPEALLVTGQALRDDAMTQTGMRSLRWLIEIQSGINGAFRPVGSDSFGELWAGLRPFDQQPLEAAATIAACLAAWKVDGHGRWQHEAARAFAWFHGQNDLGRSLIDPQTGGCRDGLHHDRVNENRGGESAVSYLLAASDMRTLYRARVARAGLRMAR